MMVKRVSVMAPRIGPADRQAGDFRNWLLANTTYHPRALASFFNASIHMGTSAKSMLASLENVCNG